MIADSSLAPSHIFCRCFCVICLQIVDDCSNSGHIICLAEEGGNLPMKNDLHVLFVPFDTSGFREVFYYVHSKIPANMVNQVSQGYIIVGTDLLPAEYCRDHVPQGMPHRQA